MQVKLSQAQSMITKCIRTGLVPMLIGSPGCGKSQIVYAIAETYNLKVIDLRLKQCDPTDLLGFPNILGKKAGYVPMETFPIEGDSIPDGYSGWLLFLDEFNSASVSVQAAAYKIILDRAVGQHKLHKNVAIVCAGNLETDNAIVETMSTAMQSRLVHLEVMVDVQEWITWATKAGIDPKITSFVDFMPGKLFSFKPDHTDKTYACPRTWEFANRLLKLDDTTDPDMLPLLTGTLSEGIAREFLGFCKIHANLPKMTEIVTNPEGIPLSDEKSVLFALTGSIAHNVTPENLKPMMKFIARLPIEFQIICLRQSIQRNPVLLTQPALQEWISKSAVALL